MYRPMQAIRCTPIKAGRLVGLAVICLVCFAGCTVAPTPAMSPSPASDSPSADMPLPAGVSEDDVQQWTAFRQYWGLRSDRAWAISASQDRSADRAMDTPLLPWELSRVVGLDQSAQDFVVRLENYGSRYPDDFAGVLIEGPMIVARFAHNVDAHSAVIGPRFESANRVRVEQARYSLEELEQLAAQVGARRALVDAVGVRFYSADVDVIDNKVRVRFQGDAVLEGKVRAALGNPDWLKLEAYNLTG